MAIHFVVLVRNDRVVGVFDRAVAEMQNRGYTGGDTQDRRNT
jgi:hypothetical protein